MLSSRLAPWRGRSLRFGLGAATAAVTTLAGVARNKWVALHLGAEGVGVIGQVVAVQTWLGVGASLGLAAAITRSAGAALGANDTMAVRRVVWTALTLVSAATAAAVTIALLGAGPIATAVLGGRGYAPLIRLASLGLAGYAFQAVLQGVFASRSDVRASFTLALGGGAGAVLATFLLVPAWGVMGGVLGIASMFPAGIAVALLVHRADYAPLLANAPRPRLDPTVARQLLGIGGAALTLALVDQGTLLALRAHYLRAHGLPANGLLQAALALAQQAGSPFYLYFANYGLGKVSGLGGPGPIGDYMRRQWTPAILLAALVCAVAMVASGPLLTLLYTDAFTPARPLMAWTLCGEFVRIAGQALAIAALPLGGVRMWLAIGLANAFAEAGSYLWLAGSGAGLLSLPLAYGVGSVATVAVAAVLMRRAGVAPRLRDVALFFSALAGLAALASFLAR